MATYVSLINWTEQGVRGFAQTAQRADDARRTATSLGGEIRDIYWTLGPYDVVVVAEFPDDETATAYLLAVGAKGNVRTTSMRAFTAEEIQEIIRKAG